MIEGKTPILREKDVTTPTRANTLATRIYLALQRMYRSQWPQDSHAQYLCAFCARCSSAEPETRPLIKISTIES